LELRRGHLFLLIGPSGSGKTTLIQELTRRHPYIRFVPTTTTRPPRPGEVHGREYFFASDDEFDATIATGGFFEWKPIHGHRYGTPKDRLLAVIAEGSVGILSVDVLGGMEIKRALADDATTIFVRPPDMAPLKARLLERGTDSAEDIGIRLRRVEEELGYADACDYVLINADGRLEEAVERLEAIVDEVLRPLRRR
jgi:guanylate kinase